MKLKEETLPYSFTLSEDSIPDKLSIECRVNVFNKEIELIFYDYENKQYFGMKISKERVNFINGFGCDENIYQSYKHSPTQKIAEILRETCFKFKVTA